MSLHLHNGRAGMRGGIRHLIRKLRQHEQMIAARALGRITRTGGQDANDAGAGIAQAAGRRISRDVMPRTV
jgi:hypothetical protein